MVNKVPHCERLRGFYLRQWVLRKVAQGDTVKTERVHIFYLFCGSKMKQM